MRTHVAEAIGTSVLVAAGSAAIAAGSLGAEGVAVAFGLTVAVLVYALGHISGAHLNPAVSVGFAIGRHLPWSRVATYALAQTLGGVGGAAFVALTIGRVDLAVTSPAIALPAAFAWEALLTALLVVVVTAVATDTRAVGQGAALAIGGTIALASLVAGPLTGASLNPARSIGPALVAGDIAALWLYVAAPVAGAVAGALLYRYLRGRPASA